MIIHKEKKTGQSNKSKKSKLDRLLTPTVLKKLHSITSNLDSNYSAKEGKRTTRSGKEIKSSYGQKKSTKGVKVFEYKRKVQIKNSLSI